MSLHDVDTTTGSRTNPTVSTDDKVVSPMAHQTISTSYTPPGEDARKQRMILKNNAIVSYDSENRISSIYAVITGVSYTPVLIIAAEGKDVFTDILGIPRPEGL